VEEKEEKNTERKGTVAFSSIAHGSTRSNDWSKKRKKKEKKRHANEGARIEAPKYRELHVTTLFSLSSPSTRTHTESVQSIGPYLSTASLSDDVQARVA